MSTTTPHEHIAKGYEEELQRLTGEIFRMGALALAQLQAAMSALVRPPGSEHDILGHDRSN